MLIVDMEIENMTKRLHIAQCVTNNFKDDSKEASTARIKRCPRKRLTRTETG